MRRVQVVVLAFVAVAVAGQVAPTGQGTPSRRPAVEVTAPRPGAVVAGVVTLRARGSVTARATGAKWYVDRREVAWDGDGPPFEHRWNTRKVRDGSHRIFAKIATVGGRWRTSAEVAFVVRNRATPRPPSPGPIIDSSHPCGVKDAQAKYSHVVWVVMENKRYTQIIGSANAPYINRLADVCGSATNFYAEAHPSLPNYIAMVSGSTQGITDDGGPSSHRLNVPTIFSQLGSGGWKALQEDMPSNCYLSDSSTYAVRHNPPVYFTNIASQCARQDVPLGSTPDLSAPFTFITPNLCNDMHSCPSQHDAATEIRTGDTWLSTWVPQLLATPQYKAGTTVIVITWDEDDSSSDANHIATLVISPSTPAGARITTRYDHYSLLRTTEELLGLAPIGNAANARSMATDFGLR